MRRFLGARFFSRPGQAARRARWIHPALALGVLTVAAFSPALGNGFVAYDDGAHITENAIVRSGLTWDGVRWAFTNTPTGNWHPLTWVSHMADVSLFGLNAGGHHLVSLALHVASSVILFLVLASTTAAPGRSLLAAALFAVHPLRVESVAWAAERKDVLAVFFWMLTLALHVRYARGPSLRRFVPVSAAAVLALLSKPMAVGLPITLLLFDVWPLGRLNGGGPAAGGRVRRLGRLVLEKIPLAAPALAIGLVTVIAQRGVGAMAPVGHVSSLTFANAVLSFLRYPVKLLWPARLSVFYRLEAGSSFPAQEVGVFVLLLAVSVAVVVLRRRNPVLAVGWAWYLTTVLPVIGVFMVGEQAMADRYTYVPSIGLILMLAWGAPGRWLRPPAARAGAIGAALAIVALLAGLTWLQTGFWKDSVTLFSRVLKTDPDNWLAHNKLARIEFAGGRTESAIAHMREAVRLAPSRGHLLNLGYVLETAGRLEEALEAYSRAAASRPPSADAERRLANLLRKMGRPEEAGIHDRRVREMPSAGL